VLEGLRLAVVAVLVSALAVWLVTILRQALGTGVARTRRRIYHERNTPVQYWLTVGVQIVVLMGCLYVLTRVVAGLFR